MVANGGGDARDDIVENGGGDGSSGGKVVAMATRTASRGFNIETVACWNVADQYVTCSDCASKCSTTMVRLLSKSNGTW